MLQIFDSLKNLINPEMISKASVLLGENDSKVSTAVSSIIPTLLGSLLKKGDSSQVKKILEEAGKTNVNTDLNNVFSGNLSYEQENVGDRFIDSLLGGKTNDVISAIGSNSGLSFVNTSKLASLVSPLIAGFLGNKIVNDNYSLSGLLSELNQEKSSFLNMIPSEVADTLGLSTLYGKEDQYYSKTNYTKTTPNDTGYNYASRVADTDDEKKNSGWWKWLLLGLLLLLALFFLWRSCNNREVVNDVEYRTSEITDTIQTRATNTANDIRDRVDSEFELPNGVRINGFNGGMEDKMISYLKSDDYRNASADDLKNKWFEFEDINFEHGSASQLSDGSQRHVDNIVAILKAYPEARIRIAGYADKTGTNAVNMEISEQRANYIKSLLMKNGIDSKRIITEGFGEEYATHSASESDAARAEDRDIAFRFVK